jgi:hypothetical protein
VRSGAQYRPDRRHVVSPSDISDMTGTCQRVTGGLQPVDEAQHVRRRLLDMPAGDLGEPGPWRSM